MAVFDARPCPAARLVECETDSTRASHPTVFSAAPAAQRLERAVRFRGVFSYPHAGESRRAGRRSGIVRPDRPFFKLKLVATVPPRRLTGVACLTQRR